MSDVFIDPRDGNTYKTVEIGNQIWLAENLRFEGVEFFAPDGDEENISEYGCLYTWDNALKAIPEGWHLPSKEDFENLVKYSDSKKIKHFKAFAALDWKNKDDSLGFRVMPSGGYYGNYHYDLGFYAIFWSTTELNTKRAYHWYFCPRYTDIDTSSKDCAYSVRCIKD